MCILYAICYSIELVVSRTYNVRIALQPFCYTRGELYLPEFKVGAQLGGVAL